MEACFAMITPLEIVADERAGLPSASTFHRTVDCPGWNNLWRLIIQQVYGGNLPPETKSQEAERGIRIHLARETSNTLVLEDESELKAYDRGLELETAAMQQWLDEFKPLDVIEGPKEKRLWLHNKETTKPELSARLDLHFLGVTGQYSERIFAPDWKTGAALASGKAATNWQGKVTAVILANTYPFTESVTFSLIKPEAFPSGHFDSHTFTRQDLIDIETEVRHHIAESQKPEAPRRAGECCQYCPCKAFCPEAAAYAMLPSVVAQTSLASTKAEIQQRVSMLTPADWVFIWQRAGMIKNITEAATACLKSLGDEGLNPLGLRLGKGRTTTEIPNNSSKQACEILSGMGLSEDDLWKCVSVDKTATIARLMASLGMTKAAATEYYEQNLTPLIVEKTGEPILREI